MKNKDILTLNEALKSLNLKGAKFAYVVARNIEVLKPEITALVEAAKQSDEYKEYEAKRVEICKEHAEKDENNEPVLINKGTVSEEYKIADQKSFEASLKKLNDENKEVIRAREKQIEEFNSLLEENKDINFHKVSLKDVPDEITSQEMASIISIIEE